MKNEDTNKRGPWLQISLISAIVIIISLIVTFSLSSDNFKLKNASSASKKESTIEVQDTEFQNIKMITETSNDSSISYKLFYPETNFESLNEKINKYITDSKEYYISKAQENNKTGHLNVNCSIYPFKEKYYSIVFTKIVTYDFSKYDKEYHTYLIEKDNGNIIDLKTMLNNSTSNFRLLTNYVQKKLLKSKELTNKVDKDAIINYTNPVWENYNSFSINNNQLVMYFNIEDPSSKETVNPTVNIKIPYLNPILNKDFKSNKKSKTNIVSDQKKKRKLVALTFDDGPHKTITKEILDTLDKYDAKATFFVVGSRVNSNKKLLKEMKEKGHEIGNHTMNHKNITKLKKKKLEYEINKTNELVKKAIGEEPTVFRPPYGATNKKINKMLDVPVVLWTVDTLDWKYRNPKKLLPVIKNNVHNNAIILMHDIHQSTADGLDSVLAYLQKEGYEFVTVSEILSVK